VSKEKIIEKIRETDKRLGEAWHIIHNLCEKYQQKGICTQEEINTFKSLREALKIIEEVRL
jgi:hypothetical protein